MINYFGNDDKNNCTTIRDICQKMMTKIFFFGRAVEGSNTNKSVLRREMKKQQIYREMWRVNLESGYSDITSK